MARALGIGGIFFKSSNPAQLAEWYQSSLGFEIDSSYGGTSFPATGLPAGAYSVWGPFSDGTTYFRPSEKAYMINIIVDELTEALEQVRQAGGEVLDDLEESELGRFGWFVDPDGNKVELWQLPAQS